MKKLALALCAFLAMVTSPAMAQQIIGVHSYSYAPGAVGSYVLFAPSTNTYGAYIRTAALFASCSGNPTFQINAVNSTTNIVIYGIDATGGIATSNNLTQSIYVPAGTGITLSQNGSGCGGIYITYDFIS